MYQLHIVVTVPGRRTSISAQMVTWAWYINGLRLYSGPPEPVRLVRPWPDHFSQLGGPPDSCKTGVKNFRGSGLGLVTRIVQCTTSPSTKALQHRSLLHPIENTYASQQETSEKHKIERRSGSRDIYVNAVRGSRKNDRSFDKMCAHVDVYTACMHVRDIYIPVHL